MRILVLLLLCLVSFSPIVPLHAADTLRHYYPQTSTRAVSGDTDIDIFARFDLPQAGTLTHIRVLTDGTGTGSFTVQLFGHEGGTPYPQLEQNLTAPIPASKTQTGKQEIIIELPDPVRLENNQFFIMFRGLPSTIRIMADIRSGAPSCSGEQDENYYIYFRDNQHRWMLSDRWALAVDAIFNYDPQPNTPLFEDVTADAGIPSDVVAYSIAASDLNADDFIDIVAGGRIFINQKDGKFVESTPEGVVATPIINALIDMDNDGREDILLLYDDSTRHQLLLNKGGGNFEVKAFGLPIPTRGAHSFSIADVNEDGYPDLFIGRLWTAYPSTGPDIVPNYLYLNDQNNSFVDASEMIYPQSWTHRRSRASAWCDFDNDGDLDLFVANYFLEPDELWQNNGDGTFTNVAQAKGIDLNGQGGSGHGTGCDWADYDNDGNFDLLLPMLAHPNYMKQFDHQPTTLYRNLGAPGYAFQGKKSDAGIQYEETHGGGAWADVNNDGLQDFYIAAYYNCRYSDLYVQNPDHTFSLKTAATDLHWFRGNGADACWTDYNGDGRIDLLTTLADSGDVLRLFRNHFNEGNNHVLLKLNATNGNKLAIGARVAVYASGKRYLQEVTAGRGIRMQKPGMLHFGIGTAPSIDSVMVRWPGSTSWERFVDVRVNALNYLEEGGKIRVNIAERQGAKAHSFHLNPNPTSGHATVSSIPAFENGTVRLYNVAGQLIMNKTGVQGTHCELDVSTLPAGVYFVECVSNGKQSRMKLVRN